ncbi:MAG: site-specific DNA-methyltransferase [Opitutales bacterium]
MDPITADSPEAKSADLIADNITKLKALFPELITEGPHGASVNEDVLKQLVGDQTVTDADEKYGLNWHGKRQARQLALTPSLGTLRPCPEESKDWDTTQNLFIEGDNLEVLKLLQKSYAGKVKLIYIDPPYNTGKDFVYPDDYRDSISSYKRLTGISDETGKALTSNRDSSGRFHTQWLNMMYPRLRLARALLSNDGCIFVSVDDNEMSHVISMFDEIFGEENFAATIIWKKRSTPPNDRVIGAQHDYIIAYTKQHVDSLRLRPRSADQVARYTNPDNHPKGPWSAGDLMANVKGGRYVPSLYFPITNPRTGEEFFPSSEGNWRFNREKINELLANDEIYFGADDTGRPKLKRFLSEIKAGITWTSLWDFAPYNGRGSEEMMEIFGNLAAFENPKPTGLMRHIIEAGGKNTGIILDFFAGSGTIGHATMMENAAKGEQMRYVLVQLPEGCGEDTRAAAAGFLTIADLAKERLRRAAAKIKEENPDYEGDLGFRVFKLDSSNIKAWDPAAQDLAATLEEHAAHLKADRTEDDILYELLLKLGLDLCVPMAQRQIAGKTVYAIGGGVLMVCLAEEITKADTEALGHGILTWHEELAPASEVQCVFRESAFADNVAKSNLVAILEQNGLKKIRSI